MQKLLKFFWLGGENHNQKTSKSGGFFPENHCRAPPRGGVFFSSFWAQKTCRIFRKSPDFFRVHKFLKIFSLGGENHSQKTSKSDGYFPENHCLLRGIPVGQMKRQKNYQIFKNSQEFFQNAKSAEDFLFGRWKSQPENQQIWWIFSRKSLPRTTPRRRVL